MTDINALYIFEPPYLGETRGCVLSYSRAIAINELRLQIEVLCFIFILFFCECFFEILFIRLYSSFVSPVNSVTFSLLVSLGGHRLLRACLVVGQSIKETDDIISIIKEQDTTQCYTRC